MAGSWDDAAGAAFGRNLVRMLAEGGSIPEAFSNGCAGIRGMDGAWAAPRLFFGCSSPLKLFPVKPAGINLAASSEGPTCAPFIGRGAEVQALVRAFREQ